MGNSTPRANVQKDPVNEQYGESYIVQETIFDLLPRELHEQIGSYIIGDHPVRLDQILGYLLVSKYWSQTIFSGPIRLVAFNKHRVSIDILERLAKFDRLSFCLDLRFCQRLGDDEQFLHFLQYHNIYEVDLRGIEFKYDINPDLGHLTSLRRLAISQYRHKKSNCYDFISGLTNLNSLIIQQDGNLSGSIHKLDLQYLLPLTNLKELALQPYTEKQAIIEDVTKLVSLKALVLNCGGHTSIHEPSSPHPSKFTALTNLQVLALRGLGVSKDLEPQMLKSIVWQTSLQRIYYRHVYNMRNLSPIWHELPDDKFKIGETLYVDVFNTFYKASFY